MKKPKPAKKPVQAKKRKSRTSAARKPRRAPGKAAASATEPKKTKAAQLRAFLQAPGGKTCAQVEAEFGWLAHSARAAISRQEGVTKTKDERGTVYAIAKA
jgi:hypothetical protein